MLPHVPTSRYATYREKIRDMRGIRIEKVIINCGVGRLVVANAQTRDKVLSDVEKILSLIAGQKPASRPARKSIASFKLREGETIGYAVTLRGGRMFDFLERMINLALPRVRDFRGIPLSNVDKHGNLSIGFSEHIIFPEVASEDVRQIYGLQVTLVPSMRRREDAIKLYREIGIPLQRG